MAATLRLDPENAAASVARRVETILQCMGYVREVVVRYDGLKAFENELARLGVSEPVADIMRASPPQPSQEPKP